MPKRRIGGQQRRGKWETGVGIGPGREETWRRPNGPSSSSSRPPPSQKKIVLAISLRRMEYPPSMAINSLSFSGVIPLPPSSFFISSSAFGLCSSPGIRSSPCLILLQGSLLYILPFGQALSLGSPLGSSSTSSSCLSIKQGIEMATQHQYYQPAAAPMNVPSKTPGPANLYPISRVSGSPPDISDTSTTAGSRTSGLSFNSGSISGDYESSTGSLSGVDVVDVLNDRMQETFDPTPLDRGLATQAQT